LEAGRARRTDQAASPAGPGRSVTGRNVRRHLTTAMLATDSRWSQALGDYLRLLSTKVTPGGLDPSEL